MGRFGHRSPRVGSGPVDNADNGQGKRGIYIPSLVGRFRAFSSFLSGRDDRSKIT
jgi:hypothetical protein